jgi:adenylyltransferase/sulfurtransferase
MELGEEEILRYARHIVLPEIGGIGQAALLRARVLIIGAGGLGCPLGLYLAAAGIGTLGIVDDDRVDVTNLQRQVAHDMSSVGESKVASLARRIAAMAPKIEVRGHELHLDDANAEAIVRGYDLVADGSDNFATRRAVHDACRRAGRTLVSASVQGVEGQLTAFKAHEGPPHPCFHCLFPEAPEEGLLPSCAQGGVLGPAAGVMGCLQAVEVVKEILGRTDESLSGTLLLYDAMAPSLERVRLRRRPDCGDHHARLSQAAR